MTQSKLFCINGHLRTTTTLLKTGGCRPCSNVASKRYKDSNPIKKSAQYRKYNLRKTFDMSVDDYVFLFDKQKGLCAICERPQTLFTRRFHVDHCHKTGKIRGLLCANCNPGIGNLQDSPELLEKAAKYLRGY